MLIYNHMQDELKGILSMKNNDSTNRIISSFIDQNLFSLACSHTIGKIQGQNGIGTLKEKTIHAILKYYYAPNEQYHEVKIGNYVADICVDGEIIEIQTRNLNALRDKLSFFLQDHEVTVCHPITHKKWISWINLETGEISNKRKSTKTGNFCHVFPELYKIKMFLNHPHLHFIFPLIDVEETRYLNGWSYDKKRGSSRCDGIPTTLFDELRIDSKKDFIKFIPQGLPEEFTVKDFAKSAKVNERVASCAVNVLFEVNIISRIGKKGRAYLYTISENLE